jgi:RNA polymerase sigma factor (sigma-70 family)
VEAAFMTAVPLASVVRHLHELAAAGQEVDLSDGQLLTCFTQTRDAKAFEALIRRHGPMVHSVCRRTLGLGPDLDDAFQATFLVLARKAGTVRKGASVGSWLYGVARRAAANVRCRRCRQHAREHDLSTLEDTMAGTTRHVDPVTCASMRELGAILDEEVERLPDHYREALLLCHFQGLSTDAAAQRQGCPSSTFKSRLIKARSLLRQRLQRRGVTLSVTALAILCSERASRAALPFQLVSQSVQAGIAFAARSSTPAAVLRQAGAAALAEQILGAGSAAGAKLLAAVLVFGLAVGTVALAGYGFLGQPPAGQPQQTPVTAAKDHELGQETKAMSQHVDDSGDPLPEGALHRLGSSRFRVGGAMALAPDGQTAVTGGSQKTHFWDVATGKLIRSVDGGGTVVAYSPDGRLVASVARAPADKEGRDHVSKVYLWDAASGKRLADFLLTINTCPSLAFSPASNILAVSGGQVDFQNKSYAFLGLWRWDGSGLKPLWEAKTDQGEFGPNCRSTALAFSADGKQLASGGFINNTIRIWSVAGGKEIRWFKVSGSQVRVLAFSPAASALASGSDDGSVALWDPASGAKLWQTKQEGDVGALAFSPDGKTLAGAGGLSVLPARPPSPFLVLLDAATGKELRRLAVQQARQYVTAVAYSKDGKVLAAACGGKLQFWDGVTGQERPGPAGHDNDICAIAVSEDGQLAATAGIDGCLILWDLAKGKEKLRLQGHRDGVVAARFVPGGKLLASASAEHDQTVRLWDLATGKEVGLLKADPQGFLYSLVVTPDGKLLVAGDMALGDVHVWNLGTAQLLHTLRNGEPRKPGVDREKMAAGINCLAISPDGKILAAGEHTGRAGKYCIVLWNPVTGKKLREIPVDDEGVNAMAFAPDGTMIASTGMSNNTLDFWDVESGDKLLDLPCGPFAVVAFSPDGKTIAVGSRKEGIFLWEIASKKMRHKFSGFIHYHHQTLAFSPDGRMLVSSGDRTALVWDVTGLERQAKKPAVLSPDQLQTLWKALASPDAAEAGRAIWSLTAAAKKAIPFLAERLRDLPGPDPKRIRQLIADLDNKDFKVRQAAELELASLGKRAQPALREALAGDVSLEVRQRIAKLLQKREALAAPADLLQVLRAIEVLEHVGTPEARQVLEQLAKQTADDYFRQQAQAAALRLQKRAKNPN